MVCLKQTAILQLWEQPTNWLNVLDLFVGLVLKGLRNKGNLMMRFTMNEYNTILFEVNSLESVKL